MTLATAAMPIISLDVDWAPDFIIDAVADMLVTKKIKATWFLTHDSAAIQRLSARPDLFELGIHPNFAINSSHGMDYDSAFQHMLKIVPTATVMRAHGLRQSSLMLIKAAQFGIKVDCSTFLPEATTASPFRQWVDRDCSIVRLPFTWEDDCEMHRPTPFWTFEKYFKGRSGAHLMNFHPIHVYMNCPNMTSYQELKSRKSSITETSMHDFKGLVFDGDGPRSMFDSTIEALSKLDGGSRTVGEHVSQQDVEFIF